MNIAAEQIKSQMTKPHTVRISHIIVNVIVSLITRVSPRTARTARSRRGMLSTIVLTFLIWSARHAWRTAWRNPARLEGRLSMFRIQIYIWSQTCSIRFHVWIHSWSAHNFDVMLVQKYHCVTCFIWQDIALHSLVRRPISPMAACGPSESGYKDTCSSPPMMDYTQTMPDWLRFSWVG